MINIKTFTTICAASILSFGLTGCISSDVDPEILKLLDRQCDGELETSISEWKGGWKVTVQCGENELAAKIKEQLKNSSKGYEINPDQAKKVMSFD